MSLGLLKMISAKSVYCDTMLGIRCVGVSGCQSENFFVCFGAKATQKACAQDLPRDRKDEGRKVPENSPLKGAAETSRDERTVKRRTQMTKDSRRRQSDESRTEKREEQKSKRRLLRPVDPQRPG